MVIGTFFNSFTTTDWGVLIAVIVIITWWAARTHTKVNDCGKSIENIEEELKDISAAVNQILGRLDTME